MSAQLRVASLIVACGLLAGCTAAPSVPPTVSDNGSPTSDDTGGVETEPVEPEPPAEPAPEVAADPFAIGSAFSQSCSVAWPSAPVITTTSIQLTLACSGVSSQYPFVLAVYADSTLPVTPSTGSLLVVGTIVDIGQSEAGFTYLIVEASSIQI